MKEKTKNIVSLVLNVIIIVSTVYAISAFFTGRAGLGNMQASGSECFRYFTNLSNIFAAVSSCVMLVFNFINIGKGTNLFPKWAMLLKFTSAAAVSVTFVTVVFFLAPLFMTFGFSYWDLFTGSCFYLHFTTPVLAAVSVMFFERCENFTKKNALLGLVPTVLYSIVYVIMVVIIGRENGGWPDFYGFTFGGRIQLVPVSLVAMYALTLLISFALRKIQQKVNAGKKAERILENER